MNEVALIGGMALVTFLVRYPLLALVGKVEMPKRIFEALRYVAPAVLAAIVAPAIFLPGDKPIQDVAGLIPLVAIIATILVMWFSKNLTLTIVVGMAVFLGLRFIIH
jgi:branched chain amino acid efflux pump